VQNEKVFLVRSDYMDFFVTLTKQGQEQEIGVTLLRGVTRRCFCAAARRGYSVALKVPRQFSRLVNLTLCCNSSCLTEIYRTENPYHLDIEELLQREEEWREHKYQRMEGIFEHEAEFLPFCQCQGIRT
jgi:hypothetical protein